MSVVIKTWQKRAIELGDAALNPKTAYGLLQSEIDELRAALAAAERDAARYRWLREPDTDVALVLDKRTDWIPEDETIPGVGGYHIYEYRAGDDLDRAIDAAMSTQEKGEKSE